MMLIGVAAYVLIRLYRENPRRLERLAREETQLLYDHAVAGRVRLSDAEIDEILTAAWPPDLPFALRVQLLQVARTLFEQEGLSPEIPPLPALCNTVEGARYRDQLAKMGQARNDRVMARSALEIIGQALEPTPKTSYQGCVAVALCAPGAPSRPKNSPRSGQF